MSGRRHKTKRKKMTEEAKNEKPALPSIPVDKAIINGPNQIECRIEGTTGDALSIYIRAPLVADIVEKLATGNYAIADYAEVYRPILQPILNKDGTPKGTAVTRPAIKTISRDNFVSGSDWGWDAPRAVLIYNPHKLREGYTLTVKLTDPVTKEQLRTWGKKFNNGCLDIIASARPFRMSWVLDEVDAPAGG